MNDLQERCENLIILSESETECWNPRMRAALGGPKIRRPFITPLVTKPWKRSKETASTPSVQNCLELGSGHQTCQWKPQRIVHRCHVKARSDFKELRNWEMLRRCCHRLRFSWNVIVCKHTTHRSINRMRTSKRKPYNNYYDNQLLQNL